MNLESRISNLESDAVARRRAVEETGNSFVVEASAGTGKTRTLLDRILHLVLEMGPGGAPVPLSRICAITFTEKAAGEMKVRLRQELEKLLQGSKDSARLARVRQALEDLETASISTFHSFAVSILKERPIESGLDPHFSALDEIRSELFFTEAWDMWMNRVLAERAPILEKALRNGFRLDGLKDLARILRLNWLNVRDLEPDPPPTEEQCQEKCREFLEAGRSFYGLLLKQEDKLAAHLANALNWLENPGDETLSPSKPANAGAAGGWSGGKDTVNAVKQFIASTVEFHTSYRSRAAQQLLYEVVCWIKSDFMLNEWEKRKRAGGTLDFDDQLRLARDLLLKSRSVRQEFQRQFKTLLVDEFQDTDPIQWEMVLLLSSSNPDEADLAKLRPEPGRLFIVGDPKQSIYRFRNADIETYLEIVEPKRLSALGLDLLKLTRNFRSVPSILKAVDAAFTGVMKPDEAGARYQPDYLGFGDHGARTKELHPPSVHFLGDIRSGEAAKRSSRQLVRLEAGRVARLIREMQGSELWKIQDSEVATGDGWRVPHYGDIAVLLPVLTHADALEEELRELGIPYVLEGGKFYYARSEVSSAITALRAIANPNDGVALYGSLRSIFFGLSDDDLLQSRIQGLELDYRVKVPRESPLFLPFEILHDLHRHRHERRASETFEILLQKTGAREVLAARGFQSLANLGKLGRTLRALQSDATFSQVLDLLGTIDEEGLAESESRLMEDRSNAVRIMTIHKSKGLDFPITISAALGLKKKARSRKLLSDPRRKRAFALHIGAADAGFSSSGWKELAEEEKKREDAELVRLLYVGLTRARDHMVLSTHTAAWKKPETSEQWVPATEGTRLGPMGAFVEDVYTGKSGLVSMIDAATLDAAASDAAASDAASVPAKTPKSQAVPDWRAVLTREYNALKVLIANTPATGILKAAGKASDPAEAEDRQADERTPEAAGNRSMRLGVAFHEAMEQADLAHSAGIADLVQEAAKRHRLNASGMKMLESMLRASMESELFGRVRAAAGSGKRVFRELPFVRPLDAATIEEGKIDLLFEEEAGWVLVDYKTDWVSNRDESVEEFFRIKYAAQVREYVEALRALPVRVASAYLLLARTGDSIRMM
jgi:ATP-dependent exoDNAse (exonuclease V) beta subunit